VNETRASEVEAIVAALHRTVQDASTALA